MIDSIMQDPDCKRYVKAIGFQWAGKDALPIAARKYPHLKFLQRSKNVEMVRMTGMVLFILGI